MLRKHISTWVLLSLLLIALGAAAVAGCGSSSTASSSTSPAATTATMSADQIVAQSEAKMKDVKSASFTGDMSLKVSGDPSKMTDPTTKALLSQGVSLHMEGKSQTQPTAADVKISLGLAGQTIDLSLLSKGTKSWVEYQGKWYVAPASTASAGGSTKSSSTSIGSLGIAPADWAASSTVNSEQVNGTTVYHITATADTAKVMSDLIKALNAPGLAKSAGSGASALNQLKSSPQLKSLEKSLASASVQYWIDASTFLVQKGTIDAKLKFGGATSASGVSGLGIDIGYSLSHFGEPVKVTPPKRALPLKSLTNGLSPLALGAGVGV